MTYHLTDLTRLTFGLRFTAEEKSRVGVNARYAFALGGRNFSCCGGVRLGTEGFRFAGRDRTIFNPDQDNDGNVSDDEYLAFYYDGIAQFGARDNVEATFAKGTYGGGAAPEDKVPCVDTLNQDDFYCPPDGLYSFVAIINPNTSITPQFGEMENDFVDWRMRVEHDFDGALGYFMISTGHKSGGFNDTFSGDTGLPVAPTYDEEQVVVFEAGWKNDFDLGDIPTRFNASGFYYDYSDQVFTSLLSVEQALDFTVGGATLVDPDGDRRRFPRRVVQLQRRRLQYLRHPTRRRLPTAPRVQLQLEGAVARSEHRQGSADPGLPIPGGRRAGRGRVPLHRRAPAAAHAQVPVERLALPGVRHQVGNHRLRGIHRLARRPVPHHLQQHRFPAARQSAVAFER